MASHRAPASTSAPAAELSSGRPAVALLPWGDLIEDFLSEIGVSLEAFMSRMTGGWLFGYADALRLQGIRSVIICFSALVDTTVRSVHDPTGATMVVLPATRLYRALRRTMRDPYGSSVQAMFGDAQGRPASWRRVAQPLAPYRATPMFPLARAIRRERCSAILCQEYESPRFDASVLIGGLLRIPVFATFQGGDWHRSVVERYVRPRALRRSAGLIIGPSVEAARVRARYGIGEPKVARIFNPLDVAPWRSGDRDQRRRGLGIAETTRVAVWHGRVDIRRKGLDVLLGAWVRLCSTHLDDDTLLLLVGNGVDAEALEREIAETRVPRVRWIREYVLDKAEIRRYLHASDVYVLPSRHEGFPVAPLEAMACGLPVVAAAAPGVPDIFGADEAAGGVVVPAGDPIALAAALNRLLRDADLGRRLGQRARARVEEAFSLHTVGTQLRAFLQERGGLGV